MQLILQKPGFPPLKLQSFQKQLKKTQTKKHQINFLRFQINALKLHLIEKHLPRLLETQLEYKCEGPTATKSFLSYRFLSTFVLYSTVYSFRSQSHSIQLLIILCSRWSTKNLTRRQL